MAIQPTTKKTKPTSTAFTVLKKASCPTLSQSGIIDYEVSADNNSYSIHIGLTGNSGTGYFSEARQAVTEVITALEQFQAKYPITSLALNDLYPEVSINSWSFLMATLLAEGLVEPDPEHPRRYRLCDAEAFVARLEKLKTKHSDHRKRNAKTKA